MSTRSAMAHLLMPDLGGFGESRDAVLRPEQHQEDVNVPPRPTEAYAIIFCLQNWRLLDQTSSHRSLYWH
ncbi:hypothetical protein PR202_gb23566 [Eleusine coracana subsp. coracana]|uniref:Uncharacterized protein n=1 Tax=Eleusine coracana subsp. coracana TaxID=191504 RepID=A0AAV5FJ49_ELECO|nr:hypothetical protein PR202_gb23566 [Eleusine coracana subsp. coracana]